MIAKNSVRKKNNDNSYNNFAGYVFLSPILAGFIVFMAFPLGFSFVLSFAQWDFMKGFSAVKFVGLDNFIAIFKDAWFIDSMKNTLIFTCTTVPISVSIGLILAVLIDRYAFFKNTLKLAIFIPYISSIIASAVVWSVILHPSFGPVNEFLKSVGVNNPPRWFGDMNWALPAVIAFSIWQQLGYIVLVYMASLKAIPRELYESVEIDGAGEVRRFFSITLPMVSPTTFFLTTMQIIGSFKVFDIISALTEGGPGTSTTVIAYYIYRSAFRYYELEKASAAAWIMFICISAITIFQWKYQKKWDSHN